VIGESDGAISRVPTLREKHAKDGAPAVWLRLRMAGPPAGENTNNGVQINFNNANVNALGSTSTANGVTTISFGANALTPLGPTGKAETAAHEGTHGVDEKNVGHNPQTFWQFYDTEYHAYQAESAVDKGLGAANETDEHPAWSPGITPQQRTTNITKDAYSNACFDVGGCP
jgi:hypothetical protein